MDLITSKETILNEINKLINSYQERENENSERFKTLTNDVSVTHEMNLKLIKEIEEKDKLIMLSEKKCYDYEIMINKIQDEANKEIDNFKGFLVHEDSLDSNFTKNLLLKNKSKIIIF